MKILCCSEFYYPSLGGSQKVVQEIAERLALRGHEVSIATSKLLNRNFTTLKYIPRDESKQFKYIPRGLPRDKSDGGYQGGEAQALPLGEARGFIPRAESKQFNNVKIIEFAIRGNWMQGFMGNLEEYRNFVIDNQFDAIIFYAAQQWTFDALIGHFDKIAALKIHIPCGYSGLYNPKYANYFANMPKTLRELDQLVFHTTLGKDYCFAKQHGIKNLNFIPNGASSEEFINTPFFAIKQKLEIDNNTFVFLTVGSPPKPKGHFDVLDAYAKIKLPFPTALILNGNYPADIFISSKRPQTFLKALKYLFGTYGSITKFIFKIVMPFIKIILSKNKTVLCTNFARFELINLFRQADLFVFASHIEYSPLVLFEACAAGLPFLSAPCGNADEIANWTGGGIIYPAKKNNCGETIISATALAHEMAKLALDKEKLLHLKNTNKINFYEKYSWDKIVEQYEKMLTRGKTN